MDIVDKFLHKRCDARIKHLEYLLDQEIAKNTQLIELLAKLELPKQVEVTEENKDQVLLNPIKYQNWRRRTQSLTHKSFTKQNEEDTTGN